MPDRYGSRKSPRDLTGVRGNQLMAEKRAADAARERERKAQAELAQSGGTTDLDDISERHGGAPVYVDDSGVVVVDYSGR